MAKGLTSPDVQQGYIALLSRNLSVPRVLSSPGGISLDSSMKVTPNRNSKLQCNIACVNWGKIYLDLKVSGQKRIRALVQVEGPYKETQMPTSLEVSINKSSKALMLSSTATCLIASK